LFINFCFEILVKSATDCYQTERWIQRDAWVCAHCTSSHSAGTLNSVHGHSTMPAREMYANDWQGISPVHSLGLQIAAAPYYVVGADKNGHRTLQIWIPPGDIVSG